MTFRDVYRSMNKYAAQMLTPEAQAATAMPPPAAPPMGAPAGVPMPPPGAGAPPTMDPAMMGAPAGAPPMDPAMGGMPPPGAWMQDPVFMQLLQQSGIQLDPNTGMAMDPSTGQPIPPEQLDQAYAVFVQQMLAQGGAGMPPQGAPMDPAMMGAPAGAPPMDPAMGGMPPQGMPSEAGGQMPTPEDQANMIASIIMDSVNAVMDQKLAAVDKKISAFADKLDAIKNMLDDLALGQQNLSDRAVNQQDALNSELQAQLRNAQPRAELPKTASYKPGNILDIMRGVKHG